MSLPAPCGPFYLHSSPYATEGRALGMTRGGWVIAPGGVQLVAPGTNS